ncbi:Isoflavone 7-O-methyltransferase [Stylosanthes scabra]|uniref:Isoflavone 7-O-methyltransferase n=1 Tax=Stylosanthes scabra TaxID=79078 RepID=A0ABU6UPS2_9FABA|nr:Isoflavone 7-O-methyltransferase [Stylosanthes scabra]
MDLLSECKASEVLEGQVVVYKHIYAYIDSICLKWCIELNIPDIIHNHGQPITLHDLVSTLQVPPSKIDGVRRLMHYLAHHGFFRTVRIHDDNNDNEEEKEAYALTIASKLLVKGTQHCIAPMVKCVLDPTLLGTYHFLGKWSFEENLTLAEVSLGTNVWDFLKKNPSYMSLFNESLASDSQMVKLALKDHSDVFEGLESIVDVGGGNGTMSKIINEMFPQLKCIVFDLPHVVDNLLGNDNLSFVGGDMFHSIPQADATLLKCVLHDWDNENCVKILKQCKDAILNNIKGGKIIIIDNVINEKCDEYERTQMKLMMDIVVMTILNGKERSEEEWKKLFLEAGFQDYKISPLTAFHSLIEVYL